MCWPKKPSVWGIGEVTVIRLSGRASQDRHFHSIAMGWHALMQRIAEVKLNRGNCHVYTVCITRISNDFILIQHTQLFHRYILRCKY